jgi:excisionase family DNA binding protein
MTNPHAVTRRRPVRARPRLPRGPKPSAPPKDSLQSADVSQPAQPSGATSPFDWSTGKTLSVKEAAFRLNKSEDTVHRWLCAGRLRGWQLGGRRCAIVVSEESVEGALRRAGEFRDPARSDHSL